MSNLNLKLRKMGCQTCPSGKIMCFKHSPVYRSYRTIHAGTVNIYFAKSFSLTLDGTMHLIKRVF